MGKLLVLVLIILCALVSVTGFLFLTKGITDGERQITSGLSQLDYGQAEVTEGKSVLEAGKLSLSQGKKEYKEAKHNLFMVLADKLFNQGKGFREAEKQIADGGKRIAKGEENVIAGEKRVAAGKLELDEGIEQLNLAKEFRVAIAIGAAFFISLSIVLGFFWRRSLARLFKRA